MGLSLTLVSLSAGALAGDDDEDTALNAGAGALESAANKALAAHPHTRKIPPEIRRRLAAALGFTANGILATPRIAKP